MRNFWIELACDGNKPIATGPRRSDGGFTLTIRQRFGDNSVRVLDVQGSARGNELSLLVYSNSVLLTKVIGVKA